MNELLLCNRYHLLNRLGAGGMGQVFRSLDRLTGEVIALKRLPAQLPADADAIRLALAHEFQSLATLRHPNIIGVRDYAFDGQGQPFFTMDLIERPRTIVEASAQATPKEKAHLLLQVLHALAYLHRRQIVHRDLKPGNILVGTEPSVDDQPKPATVKVLDFGLAAITGQQASSTGTLLYMAPETLRGEPHTPASDLYSVGVLAYEMFAGWHPFAAAPVTIDSLLLLEPDFKYLEAPPKLRAVLKQLMAKRPQERFPDVYACIEALSAAIRLKLPSETSATRESFLQAAPLIGRQQELQTLSTALRTTQPAALADAALADKTEAGKSKHSAWLVGGESGVGKSRLVNELRTQALVQGSLVLRGQATQSGGAFHPWRTVLAWLALAAELDDLEAAVLQPLVPTIADLLQRSIPALPVLDAAATQTRLYATIIALLQRTLARQSVTILLEDIHWADESSLALLHWLVAAFAVKEETPEVQSHAALAPQHGLLLIATYRQDEVRNLAGRLANMQEINLKRLTSDNIIALSRAMVGAEGSRQQLIDFLQKETEGNTFFMVEVLRSLAEEAGALGQVPGMTLPSQVFPGGIRQIVQRRLGRVPQKHRPLLQLAAVAGRHLDLAVIKTLAEQRAEHPDDYEEWLNACAEAVVLETQEGRWQFNHDKLRESILQNLIAPQRRYLHQRVAEAIEVAHTGQLTAHYADLAYHFGQAENPEAERNYLGLAADTAQAIYANASAIDLYQRLFQRLSDELDQVTVLLKLGRILKLIGQWDAAHDRFAHALLLAEKHKDQALQAECCQAIGSLARSRGDYPEALTWLSRARTVFAALADQPALGKVLCEIGNVHYQRGDLADSRTHLEAALTLARTLQDVKLTALALHCLGNTTFDQGDYALTQQYYEEALALRRQLDDKVELANSLNNLGILASYRGDLAASRMYYEESLQLRRQSGDREGLGTVLNNLGIVLKEQGDRATALAYYEESVAIHRQSGHKTGIAYSQSNIGTIYYEMGDYGKAQRMYEATLALRREIGDKWGIASSLGALGDVAVATQEFAKAQAYYRESLLLFRPLGDRQKIAYNLIGMAAALTGENPGAGGQLLQAIGLLAAANGIASQNNLVLESNVQTRYEQTRQKLYENVSEATFSATWRSHETLSPDQAIEKALEN